MNNAGNGEAQMGDAVTTHRENSQIAGLDKAEAAEPMASVCATIREEAATHAGGAAAAVGEAVRAETPTSTRRTAPVYVPPFASFSRALGITQRSIATGRYVSIPTEVFRLLMASLIKQGYFDERWYLENYPDVAEAFRNGQVKSALDHYAFAGYYEGRRPGPKQIDQAWYLKRYTDVQVGLAGQDSVDAQEHYNRHGYFEGRAADADEALDVQAWADVFRLPG